MHLVQRLFKNLTKQRLGTALTQAACLTSYMLHSRAYLPCPQCCVTSSIPACMHPLHHTYQANVPSSNIAGTICSSHDMCQHHMQARRGSPARTTSHVRTDLSPAKYRAPTASWHLHHSPSPAVSLMHPHRSFPVSPHLHPHASPAASPLQTHWSPRNIPDAASPSTVQQGQSRKTRTQQATAAAAAHGLHHAQDRQNSMHLSRKRQASMAEPSTEDSAQAQGMPLASSPAIPRTLQQPALQTHAAQQGRTTSRGSAAAPGNTPVRVQPCSVKGTSHTAAPAVSPRHEGNDGRRAVQTEQPDVHASSSGMSSSLVQAQHAGAGTGRSASLTPSKAGQEPEGEPIASSTPRQVSAKEQQLWQQLQAANKDLQRGASCCSLYTLASAAC